MNACPNVSLHMCIAQCVLVPLHAEPLAVADSSTSLALTFQHHGRRSTACMQICIYLLCQPYQVWHTYCSSPPNVAIVSLVVARPAASCERARTASCVEWIPAWASKLQLPMQPVESPCSSACENPSREFGLQPCQKAAVVMFSKHVVSHMQTASPTSGICCLHHASLSVAVKSLAGSLSRIHRLCSLVTSFSKACRVFVLLQELPSSWLLGLSWRVLPLP